MKPYFNCEHGALYHGDCLEVMAQLDVKVDAVITDPPYGTSALTKTWDKVIPMDKMWQALHSIRSDNCPIVLFGCEPFSSLVRCSNLKEYKYDWIWQKNNDANSLNSKCQPRKVTENIMVFGNKGTSPNSNPMLKYFPIMETGKAYTCKSGKQKDGRWATVSGEIKSVFTVNTGTRYPKNILQFKHDKDKYHPTQKPVALLEYLIKTYTNEGETVLDFTSGSGSLAVACMNTNRKFICIEQSKEYCDITIKRLKNNHRQMRLC